MAFSVSVQLISSSKHGCPRMLQIQRKSCLPWGEIGSVVEMFCMDIVYSLLPLWGCRAPNEAMGVNAVSKQPCSSTVFPSKRFFLSPFMGKHKARVQREICWSQHFTKQHSNIDRLGSPINTCATKLCFSYSMKVMAAVHCGGFHSNSNNININS